MDDYLQTGKLSQYRTNTKVSLAFYLSVVGKSLHLNLHLCWMCDPIWQVMLRRFEMGSH